VTLVWVGPDRDDPPVDLLRAEVGRAGLADRVRFVGERASAAPVLARAEVVVSLAREDPFPLALLEAGALGRPVVAFDSGGASELLSGIGGVIAPLDVSALARAVADLLEDPPRAARAGRALARRVEQRHDLEVAAAPLWDDVLAEASR